MRSMFVPCLFALSFSSGLSAQDVVPVESRELPLTIPSLTGGGPVTADIRTERSCPAGLAEVYTRDIPDQSWNVVEIGVQTALDPRQPAQAQLYTRYTCRGPLEKP